MMMSNQEPPPPKKRAWVPYLVLIGALLLTGVATYSAARLFQTRDRMQFENSIAQTQDAIHRRLEIYTDILVLGSALYDASLEVTYQEFRDYVRRLRVDQRYPGVQGIGFTVRVPSDQKETLTRRMRLEGFPDFRIWPETTGPECHSIIYLEPLDVRNQRAIGYDMWTEPVRQAAMFRAMDSGEPAASGRVTLVQEIDTQVQPGFLIYVPVYRGGQIPPTVEERRRELIGFIYSPFRAVDLLHGIFGDQAQSAVDFRVFDGTEASPQNLLYQSTHSNQGRGGPRFHRFRSLTVAGREWTLEFASGAFLEATSGLAVVPFLGMGGLAVSLLLFRLTSRQAKAYVALEQSASKLHVSQVEVQRLNRELEERVRLRTAALQETNDQLEAFTYTVAHDLRAPLRAMQGFSQALLEDYHSQLEGNGRDYAQRIIAAAQRMDSLIQDLLAYSRLSRARLMTAPMESQPIVDRLLRSFAAEISAKNAVVTVEGPLPQVRAHAGTLEHILSHLLSNALKFTAPEVQPRVRIWAKELGGSVRICVEDNGIGIPAEHRERIFRVFERLHGTESFPGTGIGLAIVRKGAERMGGEVGLESQLGQGSLFWISLAAVHNAKTAPT